MTLLIIAISMYLTYYTGNFAWGTWKKAKPAGIVLFLFAGCFLPLSIWLVVSHRL